MTVDPPVLLAIETSCDETAAAVIGADFGVRSSIVASQAQLHAEWGGVVPDLASRQHVAAMNGVVRAALSVAGVQAGDLKAVAATIGPGLPGSLSVGVAAAKALALAWSKPFVAVNHLEGHLFSAELDGGEVGFPAVYLLVSGGHCMLVHAPEHGEYELIGSTRDDSVGEAYDKVARELGLGYPGGPVLDRMAPEGHERYALPRPMLDDGYDFSFSGLKTAVRREIEKGDAVTADLVTSFVASCMDVLTTKLLAAIEEFAPRSAVVVGGVAASPVLRERLTKEVLAPTKVIFPSLRYSTDNAAMIGAAAWWQLQARGPSSDACRVEPHMPLRLVNQEGSGAR
jgi:N6-L-threonylcarbamoyladenine synthase